MEILKDLLDVFLHLDTVLNDWATTFGGWLYLVLFLIVFCETGLVVTPFLPGDSLLFAVGALAAMDSSTLSMPWLVGLLSVAAISGDSVNYFLGQKLGARAFQSESSRFFNKNHLVRTHAFYEVWGGITIIIARFMPIIRTFAPFVAGMGTMNYRKFWIYNIVGGIAWVMLFLLVGYNFGNIPGVKRNFQVVIFAIIFISILPMAIELILRWKRNRAAGRVSTQTSESLAATTAVHTPGPLPANPQEIGS